MIRPYLRSNLRAAFLLVLVGISIGASSAWATITIGTVPVGDLGNINDVENDSLYGGVAYAYNIGKYEVTVGEYTEFLNAVAATDTYGLYNTNLATDFNIAGISRSGSPGSYFYSMIGSPNHPVAYVSWGDAARFANWIHNGQPTGAQDATTTEDGAYTLNGAITDAALSAVSRNLNAKWFIPTENEWYKAAYYQPIPQGGDIDGYWKYPVRTNGLPYSDQPPGATPNNALVANFYRTDNLANGYNDGFAVTGSTTYSSSQNYLTDVGAYTSASTYYGTFDQGGNLSEWNETLISGTKRGERGGSAFDGSDDMWWLFRGSTAPSGEFRTVGLRLATIPEPCTSMLVVAGLAIGALRSRRWGAVRAT